MQRLRILTFVSLFALTAAGVVATGAAAQTPAPAPKNGHPFTPMKTQALYPGEGSTRPLAVGRPDVKRPIVVCYFVVGEALGEEAFLDLQTLAQGELKGKIDFYGATMAGRELSVVEMAERLVLLSVSVPVVVEETLELGSALAVTSAPSISLIDAGGVVRITDAKGLRQMVAPGLTMAQAIRNAAAGKPVPTAGKLVRYYPATEFVGKKPPDFTLKRFDGKGSLKLSDVLARNNGKEKKITVLFFWHPNCVHCKKIMPAVVGGYTNNSRYLDLVAVTDLKNSDEERNAGDTIRVHKMTFPVLTDEGRRISDLFKVVSTPTVFFIRPDGTVESVYTRTDEIDYLEVMPAKVKSILGVEGRRPASGSAAPSPGSASRPAP